MICALTVRTLVPGTFDQFREAFMRPMESGDPPAGFRERRSEVCSRTPQGARRIAGPQGATR